MAVNSLICADVPLTAHSVTHSGSQLASERASGLLELTVLSVPKGFSLKPLIDLR